MILPPAIRIFFGIPLPDAARKIINDYICHLKKLVKPHTVRWTRAENLHITLQFIGEAKTSDLPRLIEQVRTELKSHTTLVPLRIGQLQLFPTPYRPRVLVLDITPQDQLAALATCIGRGIRQLSYEVDKRPFRAHVTIGRLKYSHGIDLNTLLHENPPIVTPMAPFEIVLFRSEPHENGSHYTILERVN